MEELYRLVASADDDTVYSLLNEIYRTIGQDAAPEDIDWEYMLTHILRHPQAPKEQARAQMFTLKRLMVAASVLILLGLGAYYMMMDRGKKEIMVAKNKDIPAPNVNRSTITLFDGTVVPLDSLSNGLLLQEGGVSIVKLANGQIAYRTADGAIQKELKYNTVANPTGSKVIDMLLSDGTRVWLNAGSSLKFPIAFTGGERLVEVSGEAYFEVAHDKSRRFKVKKGDMEVAVLGTKFNVNAYDDDDDIRITLLEGSVRLKLKADSLMLKPGQQGVAEHSALSLQPSVDVDQVMAWKSGFFAFDNSSLKEVIMQISRWYGLNIENKSNLPERRFTGKIPKDISLSNVLKIIEESGVHLDVVDENIIIYK